MGSYAGYGIVVATGPTWWAVGLAGIIGLLPIPIALSFLEPTSNVPWFLCVAMSTLMLAACSW